MPFLDQLVGSFGHFSSLLFIDLKASHDAPFPVCYCHWEAVEEAFRNVVGVVVGADAEGDPVVVVAQEPAFHVLQGCVAGTCCA